MLVDVEVIIEEKGASWYVTLLLDRSKWMTFRSFQFDAIIEKVTTLLAQRDENESFRLSNVSCAYLFKRRRIRKDLSRKMVNLHPPADVHNIYNTSPTPMPPLPIQ